MNIFWKYGEKIKLVREVGMILQCLYEYVLGEENGGRILNCQLVLKFEKVSCVVFGKGCVIFVIVWMQLEKYFMIDNFFSKRKQYG